MNLGEWGEATTARYLTKKGYDILARNYRFRHMELDLIAGKGDVIAFVEVKTRRNLEWGLPCEAVTIQKQRNIKKAAACYMAQTPLEFSKLRMDVAEILYLNGKAYIHYIENAF